VGEWNMSVTCYESWLKTLSLQADWRLFDFDSRSACLATPTTTTAYDRVGTNHGTYQNGVVLTASGPLTGRPNFAATFNGVDQYVTMGNVLNQTTNDFSIVAWAKPSGVPLVSKKGSTSNAQPGFYLNLGTAIGGNMGFVLSDGVNVASFSAIFTGTEDSTRWHFVVGVRNSGQLYGYLDGVSLGSPAVDPTGSLTNTASLYFARLATSYANSSIARVSIVTGALTPAQVAEGYRLARAAPQRGRRMTAGARRMALLHGE
jgi:hypothetical protein